jgi:high-affinity Fe2+/Pb2+ permease
VGIFPERLIVETYGFLGGTVVFIKRMKMFFILIYFFFLVLLVVQPVLKAELTSCYIKTLWLIALIAHFFRNDNT